MTQQYLVGELSVLLEQLQTVATDPLLADLLSRLRQEEEAGPVTALDEVAVRALQLGRNACWERLSKGDIAACCRGASICAELRQFGVCAHLLAEA